MFTNTESLSKTKHNLTFRMGQKLSSKLLFRSSPNTDGLYTFYVSQGSVATQLRCGGIFSNHFTTNFSQNVAVKKFENRSIFGKDMGKILWLTFLGHPVYCRSIQCTMLRNRVVPETSTMSPGTSSRAFSR